MPDLKKTKGYHIIAGMMTAQGKRPFQFQEQTWQHIVDGKSGLVNAPTGCGKTYSVFLGAIIDFINRYPDDYEKIKNSGLQLLWITPLRALAADIGRAMEEVISILDLKWKVGIRNGDTSTAERARQKARMPEILIITPESLHLLIAQKGYAEIFSSLKIIAVDEWHELLGSKRGVQVELAIARIVNCETSDISHLTSHVSRLSIWGISATIGNLEEAKEVLLSPLSARRGAGGEAIVRAEMKKQIEIESIFPDEIEKYPWAGHLGIKLINKVLPIIHQSNTTLIFINTRGMSEIWYQQLLNASPDLAGILALHHGSVERELREWVEENLHTGKLKAVVCTASLDLGVDFRPVETVIQVGSPKGVARFLQRAGRSGHQPDAISKIYFLPTHSLELVEAAALKSAIKEELIESRVPMLLCYDVLLQWLCTLAISDGFTADEMLTEIRTTYCYREITEDEWQQILHHLISGGNALQQYDEYKKVELIDGVYRITKKRIALRHRLHIGTIVSEPMMKVQMLNGGFIGVIEEWFISRLNPGDVFSLAGRKLEYVSSKEMTAYARRSTAKKSIVPSWQGGRMPLSANLGRKLRETLDLVSRQSTVGSLQSAVGSRQSSDVSHQSVSHDSRLTIHQIPGQSTSHDSRLTIHEVPVELSTLQPLFELQEHLSHLPKANELLIEHIETDEGFHLFVYPFEGRLVHEAMAAILAYRISRITPITFSFAMNDYGFELLSDQPIPLDDSNAYELFSPEDLFNDIQRSVNSTEMAKRKFRDIATIGGLIFQGMPGERKKARHLQASASLLFNVFNEYEPHNLLLRQSYNEVFAQQMEETRLRDMLTRIQRSKIIVSFPERYTPFCFPIKVDSWREDLSSEKLEDRVRKMQIQLLE
ncbi:MAG TPA: ligase-associated DNA damage response DEXH box helicase [Chitinophagaceae bacterium]|nr:ligase-associated DNA damage response DEXH box helicase [Chitinophagaceae bacterium]